MFRSASILCLILFSTSSAVAQTRTIDPNTLPGPLKRAWLKEDEFSTTFQIAQRQARDAWGHVDPGVVACMRQTYQPPPETLADKGVGPTDPGIASFYNRCVQSVNAQRDRQRLQQQAHGAEEPKEADSTNTLKRDPALVSVLDADKHTVTVLVVGRDTSNVIRNIKGQPVFQKPVSACLPFGAIFADSGTPDWRFLDTLKDRIAEKGGAPVDLTLCESKDVADYDLVMFSGTQASDGTLDVLVPLVEALRKHQLVLFKKYRMVEFEGQEQAKVAATTAEALCQKATREEAAKSFQTRDPAIISAIYLQSPAATVCLITSWDMEGLRYLLQRADSPFADLAGKSVFREFASADGAFIALKKQECMAVIAPAGDLKDIAEALGRDNVQGQIHPGIIGRDCLAHWRNIKAEEHAKGQEETREDATLSLTK